MSHLAKCIIKRMDKLNIRGIAMVTVLIFMLLVTIIAGAALSIMTKQARLAEHQIRRVRGFYAAESAINKAYVSLRYAPPTPPNCDVPNQWCRENDGTWKWVWSGDFEWRVTGDGTVVETRTITVRYNPTATYQATYDLQPYELRAEVNYSP
jgi:Tfp pilus assembly protein PilX